MLFGPLLGLFWYTARAEQRPLTPEQAQILDGARSYALNYSASLPDFLCNQIVRRSEDLRGDGRWRQIDALNIKVSYFGHSEDYTLMEVNGRPSVLDYKLLGGTISTGEFGSRLLAVFARQSHTEFGWKGWSHVRHHRVAVFTYRVARENSANRVQVGTVGEGPNSVVIGYHGELSVDPESNAVMRVTLTGDLPPGFAINGCSSWVEYDYRTVAGRPYLLPVESETGLSAGRYKSSNHIEFQEYRKFQTDATITFK